MAWPLAVGLLSFTIMAVTDTLLMGRVNTAAQGAVALSGLFALVLVAFFRGLCGGPQAVVAAADGAGDRGRVREAASAGLLFGLGGGLVGLMLLVAAVAWSMDLVFADPELIGPASNYLIVLALGLPFDMGAYGAMSVLQGLGDTRTRMWASVAANAVNIGLDIVLIFGLGPIPALGETGAAVASVAGMVVASGIYLLRYRQLVGPPVRPSRDVVVSAWRLGVPSGAQFLLGVSAFVTTNLVLARVGPAHVAASGIVLEIMTVSFLPGRGLGEAAGTLVGRYLGARRPDAADRAMRSARLLALAIMGAFGVAFFVGADVIAAPFSRDPEVLALCADLLRIAAVLQLFDAAATVHLYALRGAGDMRFTLIVSTASAWLLMVPGTLFFALVMGWGATGAWLGLLLHIAVMGGVTWLRMGGLATGRVGRLDLLLGRSATA
ncbi:MAG: MATE family efflux transporter [Myxococcales bacterium]|nr:MATE family efflux transporter [Myxococcales bacterium]